MSFAAEFAVVDDVSGIGSIVEVREALGVGHQGGGHILLRNVRLDALVVQDLSSIVLESVSLGTLGTEVESVAFLTVLDLVAESNDFGDYNSCSVVKISWFVTWLTSSTEHCEFLHISSSGVSSDCCVEFGSSVIHSGVVGVIE